MYYTYLRLSELDRAEDVAIMRDELVPNHPSYQIELAYCYLLSRKPDKSVEVLHEVLKENPENVEALLKIGEAYLHVKDLNAAEEAFGRAIYLMPEHEAHWTKLLDHVDFVRNREITEEFLRSFENIQRREDGGMTSETRIIQNQLSFKANNQRGLFIYPISDTVFVYAFKMEDAFSFIEFKWFFNSSGKAVRLIGEQWDGSAYYFMPFWIEDSLILHAKEFLVAGQNTKALATFREAYAQNPEHYYLANYIRHLEFILSSDYETLKSVFKSYVGYFGDLRFHTEEDRLFCIDYEGLIFELLPLSKDMFMVPSKYELQVQIVKENGLEIGLKYIHRDDREEYFQRTTTETWPD